MRMNMSIILDKVNFVYSEETAYQIQALKDVNLEIKDGQFIGIIGHTGSGKSTFLRCLNLLEQPTAGTITFAGTEITDPKVNIDAMRRQMGMVFQHFNLFPHLTVKKNLELAPTLLKLKDKEAISAKADELLARVGLTDKADAYPKSLSGGQQQRVMLARVLISKPQLLLLDEPAVGVDQESLRQLAAVLKRRNQEEAMTIFLITHGNQAVFSGANRFFKMEEGGVEEK